MLRPRKRKKRNTNAKSAIDVEARAVLALNPAIWEAIAVTGWRNYSRALARPCLSASIKLSKVDLVQLGSR